MGYCLMYSNLLRQVNFWLLCRQSMNSISKTHYLQLTFSQFYFLFGPYLAFLNLSVYSFTSYELLFTKPLQHLPLATVSIQTLFASNFRQHSNLSTFWVLITHHHHLRVSMPLFGTDSKPIVCLLLRISREVRSFSILVLRSSLEYHRDRAVIHPDWKPWFWFLLLPHGRGQAWRLFSSLNDPVMRSQSGYYLLGG
jgi:hypothetical protein